MVKDVTVDNMLTGSPAYMYEYCSLNTVINKRSLVVRMREGFWS